MYDDLDLVFKIVNSLGILGFALLVVMAFYRGLIISSNVQTRIDTQIGKLEEEYEAKIDELYEQRRALYEKRIADLESLLKERELRVEQNVAMLSTFVEAQDKMSRLAQRLEELHGN